MAKSTIVSGQAGSSVRAALNGMFTEIYTFMTGAAPLNSPVLTGNPTAPTQAAGNNSTRISTTAFVRNEIALLLASAPGALDTLNELATALGNDPNFAATMVSALSSKAPLASPALTGAPTAPTAAAGTNTTQLSTTAFVRQEIASLIGSAPTALDTLSELATALGNDANFVTTITTSLGSKAPINSPALTGVPTAPTAGAGTNSTQISTTAFVRQEIAALIASSPGALDTLNELAASLGNDANFATTVATALAAKAPLASPALTGTPTAPTAGAGANTTQLATTAFVHAAVAAGGGGGGGGGAVSIVDVPLINNNKNNFVIGVGTGTIFRLTSSGDFDITGFEAATDSTEILLFNGNVSTGNLTIKHNDGNSTAELRAKSASGADIVLKPQETMVMFYDLKTGEEHWRASSSTFVTRPTLLALFPSGASSIVNETATARTLALTDSGLMIRLTNAAACTITLPANATVDWASVAAGPPLISFTVEGAFGPVLSAAGVTVKDPNGIVAGLVTGNTFAIQWLATDTWIVI